MLNAGLRLRTPQLPVDDAPIGGNSRGETEPEISRVMSLGRNEPTKATTANIIHKYFLVGFSEMFSVMVTIMIAIPLFANGRKIAGTFDPITNYLAGIIYVGVVMGVPVLMESLWNQVRPTGELGLLLVTSCTGMYGKSEKIFTMPWWFALLLNLGVRLLGQACGWGLGGLMSSKILTHNTIPHDVEAIQAVGDYGLAINAGYIGLLYAVAYLSYYWAIRDYGVDEKLGTGISRRGTTTSRNAHEGTILRSRILYAIFMSLSSFFLIPGKLAGTCNFWVGLAHYTFGVGPQNASAMLLATTPIAAVGAIVLIIVMGLFNLCLGQPRIIKDKKPVPEGYRALQEDDPANA